jgi:hypothetical protein
LVLYSEDFNITWQTPGSSIIETSTIFPNGDISGPNLVENDNNTFHNVQYPNLSFISGVTYTVSIFAKFSGRNVLQIAFGSASFGLDAFANFNLNTGTIGTVGTNATAKMEMFPNGWYRCIITSTATDTDTSFLFFLLQRFSADPRFSAYLGNGSDGILIWGAQLEVGAFPTSYIPTQASTRTRAADNASITGKNFSEWYRQDEGTLFCSGIPTLANFFPHMAAFFDSENSVNNTYRLIFSSNNLPQPRITVNSVNVLVSTFSNIKRINNLLLSYQSGNSAISANGSILNSSIIFFPLNPNKLNIGRQVTQNYLNGTISRLTYFPKRLPNAQLQALTR